MSARVTIKSIAQDLGISHMTVSRALSNHPKVREATRRAVLQRAHELGYVKSAAAMTIRGDKAEIVGLLVPNLINEFYARFSNKLAELCNEKGWQPIIHVTNDDIVREKNAILKLREIQAGAVVMVPAPGDEADRKEHLRDLQVIQLIRKCDTAIHSGAILVDDAEALKKAVDYLRGLGHVRIAYIGGATSLSSGHSRLDAFKAGVEQAGLLPENVEIYTGMPSFGMGLASTQEILSKGTSTAIVCGGVEISNGSLNGCLQQGVTIPEDISFIGYGDPSYYRWIGQGITAIGLPVDDLAINTVQMLHRKWTDEQSHLIQTQHSAELIIRKSCRKLYGCNG